jgi:hypothetical protein
LRDNNIFYQEGLPYLIPAVGSSRTLEGELEACDTNCGNLPSYYYQPRTPRTLCNYYRAWILGNSVIAFNFATFSPKGAQDIKLIANTNEPFPTGAKQRDQTDYRTPRIIGNRRNPRMSTDVDISSWKESGNHISIVQGCRDPIGINSCYAAYHTSLNYDNVITLVVEGNLRLSIGISNTSPTDVSSATQDRKSGCPLLEGDLAYRSSYILEPHFTPEFAEVGLLPSFGITRMTHSVNYNYSSAMDRRRQFLSKLLYFSQRMYG